MPRGTKSTRFGSRLSNLLFSDVDFFGFVIVSIAYDYVFWTLGYLGGYQELAEKERTLSRGLARD